MNGRRSRMEGAGTEGRLMVQLFCIPTSYLSHHIHYGEAYKPERLVVS